MPDISGLRLSSSDRLGHPFFRWRLIACPLLSLTSPLPWLFIVSQTSLEPVCRCL